jgi:hypothetical protein
VIQSPSARSLHVPDGQGQRVTFWSPADAASADRLRLLALSQWGVVARVEGPARPARGGDGCDWMPR